jgi:hypothetical protein
MNILSYLNRPINTNKKVKVYRNLKKNIIWSIKQGKYVVAHVIELSLINAVFLVNQNGRNKVLKEKQKNVHAYIFGFLSDEIFICSKEAYYNPYLTDSFIDKKSKEKIVSANKIYLNKNAQVFFD